MTTHDVLYSQKQNKSLWQAIIINAICMIHTKCKMGTVSNMKMRLHCVIIVFSTHFVENVSKLIQFSSIKWSTCSRPECAKSRLLVCSNNKGHCKKKVEDTCRVESIMLEKNRNYSILWFLIFRFIIPVKKTHYSNKFSNYAFALFILTTIHVQIYA